MDLISIDEKAFGAIQNLWRRTIPERGARIDRAHSLLSFAFGIGLRASRASRRETAANGKFGATSGREKNQCGRRLIKINIADATPRR